VKEEHNPSAAPQQGEMSESEIDDNLEETFPASDPPSWTLGTDHREEPAGGEKGDESADE
jgi:hypothetical protein